MTKILTLTVSLLRVDHPNNIKRGGVCMYIKRTVATNQTK